MKKLFILLILIGLLMPAGLVLAQTTATDCDQYCSDPYNADTSSGTYSPPTGKTCLCNPLGYDDIAELIDAIVKYILYIALIVAPVMIIIGAFIFMTSGGNMDKVKIGKALIKWTIIGLVIILGSRAIIALIRLLLGA